MDEVLFSAICSKGNKDDILDAWDKLKVDNSDVDSYTWAYKISKGVIVPGRFTFIQACQSLNFSAIEWMYECIDSKQFEGLFDQVCMLHNLDYVMIFRCKFLRYVKLTSDEFEKLYLTQHVKVTYINSIWRLADMPDITGLGFSKACVSAPLDIVKWLRDKYRGPININVVFDRLHYKENMTSEAVYLIKKSSLRDLYDYVVEKSDVTLTFKLFPDVFYNEGSVCRVFWRYCNRQTESEIITCFNLFKDRLANYPLEDYLYLLFRRRMHSPVLKILKSIPFDYSVFLTIICEYTVEICKEYFSKKILCLSSYEKPRHDKNRVVAQVLAIGKIDMFEWVYPILLPSLEQVIILLLCDDTITSDITQSYNAVFKMSNYTLDISQFVQDAFVLMNHSVINIIINNYTMTKDQIQKAFGEILRRYDVFPGRTIYDGIISTLDYLWSNAECHIPYSIIRDPVVFEWAWKKNPALDQVYNLFYNALSIPNIDIAKKIWELEKSRIDVYSFDYKLFYIGHQHHRCKFLASICEDFKCYGLGRHVINTDLPLVKRACSE